MTKRYSSASPYLERVDYSWSDDSIRYINTPSISARQSYFFVQEVGYFRTVSPYFTERANLNSFLIIYTLSGKGLLKYQGTSYYLHPGSVILINCMEQHYYECLSGQEWEFLWLHFNGSAALGYYEEFSKNNFHVLREQDAFFMESTMRRILSLTIKKDLHSEIIVSKLITDILTQLLIENSTENMGLGVIPEYIRKSIKEIEIHFYEPLSLDYFAKQLSISKFHFAREFKKYIGLTPNEYLNLIRINHSKELLKYSQLTVEEIAIKCGYNYPSHFINQFKKFEGSTPLQYRKAWNI